jgi:hypothetical protein
MISKVAAAMSGYVQQLRVCVEAQHVEQQHVL